LGSHGVNGVVGVGGLVGPAVVGKVVVGVVVGGIGVVVLIIPLITISQNVSI